MNLRKDHYRLEQVGFKTDSLQTQISARFVSRLVLSFGVATALEASHGDGLKLTRARRDASFKEVGLNGCPPRVVLADEGRSRFRTEGYLRLRMQVLGQQLRPRTAARFK